MGGDSGRFHVIPEVAGRVSQLECEENTRARVVVLRSSA